MVYVRKYKRKDGTKVTDHTRRKPHYEELKNYDHIPKSKKKQKGSFSQMVCKDEDEKLNEFIFSDYDKDGTKNIDDPKPFDKNVDDFPSQVNNLDHYRDTRFGGGEVKLSDVLKKTYDTNQASSQKLKKILKDNPGSYGRIKTVPSTLNKLVQKYGEKIHDTAGITIIAKNRKEVYKIANDIKKKYSFDPSETDDFYKNPKGRVYRAYHIGLLDENGSRIEVQVKTKPMAELHKEMHEAYKNQEDLMKFKKRSDKLYKQGY